MQKKKTVFEQNGHKRPNQSYLTTTIIKCQHKLQAKLKLNTSLMTSKEKGKKQRKNKATDSLSFEFNL
jgi:hypothetical protein